MMELSVWEQGEQIGTVTAQQEGLFYIFICKISKHAEQLRRIYVISKWRVEYLGIPYPRREGAELQACIPVSHFPDGLTAAAAAAMPRGAWLPWCGEADGVPIRNGLLKQLEDGYALALLPEEAQQNCAEGCTVYGAYYVPAVSGDFAAGMPAAQWSCSAPAAQDSP